MANKTPLFVRKQTGGMFAVVENDRMRVRDLP
jgi:hypothetical protein